MNKEFKSVSILALGFGLVGIDRYLIATMFPYIARDLHLTNTDIGVITGALSFAWAIAAIWMGNMSDRIGRRYVLTGALIVFAVLIGASGLATGLMGLVAVRIFMGFADGGFTPASISATIAASHPKRHGMNIGIQQMTLTLFGLGISPLIVAFLLKFIDWRWIFLVFALPGFLLAWATWKVIPPKKQEKHVDPTEELGSLADFKAALSYRNLRILTVLMLCWLTCLVITGNFMPSYMMHHLNMSTETMGTVMSAIGFGAMFGAVGLPWLSDKIGRKPVMMGAALGDCLMLVVVNHVGPSPVMLFICLFLVHFFNNALITLTVGPLCSETVPPRLMATASGLVIGIGEIFGGGLAPIIAGLVSDRADISFLLWLPIATTAVGFLLTTRLTETLPALTGRLEEETQEG